MWSVIIAVCCIVADDVFYGDQFVAVSKSVTIHCHASNSQPVLWEYKSSAEKDEVIVYDQHLISGYELRCTIDESTYDLTIHKTQLNDTGEYWCRENEGFGTKHVTKLYVTGTVGCVFNCPSLTSLCCCCFDNVKVTTHTWSEPSSSTGLVIGGTFCGHIQSNPGFTDTTAMDTCPPSCHPNCGSFPCFPLRLYTTNTRGLEIVHDILATRSCRQS